MVGPREMLHRASEPGWESLEGPIGVLLFSPPYPASGLLMGSLEAETAPLREVGMLEPEGSVAAGLRRGWGGQKEVYFKA